MQSDRIQDLSILGLKYARFLTDGIDAQQLKHARTAYSYLHIYSYETFDVQGIELLRIQPTPIINLEQSLEDIHQKFRTLTRRGIRKAEATPDLRFSVPANDLDLSYQFYKDTKTKAGVVPDIKREFHNCVFFNAYFKNSLIASISFYDNGRCLRCKHIVSGRKEMGEENKIAAYAARKLIWDGCKYGKSRGYKTLDLGGINFDDPAKRGVAQFKSSFGGIIQNVYVYRCETQWFTRLRRVLRYLGRNIH